jgi:F0F1-type ATP synthase assembly protein I
LTDESHGSSGPTPAQKNAQDLRTQSALAMEVPITIVGAIVLAGFLGYLADRWLHTSPWLMIGGGGLGFVGSMLEITRRFRPR